MAKKTKKLSVKRETLRQLDSLTDDQMRAVAGGSIYVGGASTGCNSGIISSLGTSRDTLSVAASYNYSR